MARNTIGNIRVKVNKPDVIILFGGQRVGIQDGKSKNGHVIRYPETKHHAR